MPSPIIDIVQTPGLGQLGASRLVSVGGFKCWLPGHQEGDEDHPVLRCLLGPRASLPVRGYGGWESLQRQGRRGRANNAGQDTLAVSINLLLIDWRYARNSKPDDADTVLEQWRKAERLFGLERHDDAPAPKVKFEANMPHHDYSNATQNVWRCESLEWTDNHSDDSGTLVWQQADLVLGLDDAEALKVKKATGFARKTLPAGKTLRWFAQQYLGDKKRWQDVADLNRDDSRCPKTPEATRTRDIKLLVPPRESSGSTSASVASGGSAFGRRAS